MMYRRGLDLRYLGAFMLSIVAGSMVALQSRINGQLGLEIGSGPVAALFSFSTGTLALAAILLFSPAARSGINQVISELRGGSLPWWTATGGLGGGLIVLTQGISAGTLGIALFSVALVTGQTLGSATIDSTGWFGAVKINLSLSRTIGALLAVAGAYLALSLGSSSPAGLTYLFALPALAGLAAGYQQAVNGRIRGVAKSALAATFLNFIFGTLLVLLVVIVLSFFSEIEIVLPQSWWLWTGGLVGTIFIAIQTKTVGIIGVLGLGVSLVSGQLLAAVVLDLTLPIESSGPTLATIMGAMVTLVGAVLVIVGRRN